MTAPGSVTIYAPDGRGGIASAVGAVVPELGSVVRWVATGRRDGERTGARALARCLAVDPGAVAHVHTSLRERALVRDLALLTRARAAGAATVVSVHGWSLDVERRLDAWPAARSLLLRTLLRADAITVLTAHQEGVLRRWGARDVAPVGNAWDPRAVARGRAPGPPTVLFLGRLVAEKRPALLLEALAYLSREVEIVIAGDGPLDAELRMAAAAFDGRVHLPGWLDADGRRDALARASVLVLPSTDEAMPVAVLEALASGLPVVATPVGAVPDLVDGVGWLLHDTSPAALARAIEAALEAAQDPATALRARERASPFAPARIAGEWRSIYERVTGATR